MSTPAQTAHYNGPITKAVRWTQFHHRPDDIFLCAPAKHGTTWIQAICAMLIFGRADIDVSPGKISPWIDASFEPAESVNAMLEAQTHRRFVKTHTPLDGIPFYPECQYLAIYRDPRDALISMLKLAQNVGGAGMHTPVDIHKTYADWVRARFVRGLGEQATLAATVHHFIGFWNTRYLQNVHLFHYADLKRDLPAAIAAIAQAIGIEVDARLVAEIAEATSFANMQRDAERFAPAAGKDGWKSQSDFFRAGISGQWRDVLTPQEQAVYRSAIAALLPPDAVAWLENGSIAW